jgi:predicted RNase H-like HicB family nuclease
MRDYIGLIHKDAGSDYGVSFPDLPGCISAGSSLAEARAMAVEALALHIQGLQDDGEAIPEPSTLDAIMADPANRSGVAFLAPVAGGPSRAVRVNVTLPEDALSRIDAYAEQHGYTRSGFLLSAANRVIETA